MKFFDLFPTPKFLTLSEAGVSISERAIHFISFKPLAGGDLRLERSGSISLPEGVISAGAVTDVAQLTGILTRLKKEQGFEHIAVSLPEEKAYLYTAEVEHVPYRDLYDAAAFTVEENAPVSLAKSLFAFEILEETAKVKVAASVLPLEVVEAYTEAFKTAGLMPVSYDIEPEAVARAIIDREDSRSHLIIHLSERKAGFYMVDEGVVQFSSTIPLGMIGTESEIFLQTEIRKFFVFWNAKVDESGGRSKPVERVILSGEGAADDAFASSIMSVVEVPYTLANVWANVCALDKRLPDMPFGQSLAYAAAIGSALRQNPHAYV